MSSNNWIQLSGLLSLLLLLATLGSHTATGQPLSPACPNKFDITKNSKTLQALYCASPNVDLSSSANDEEITHAIFVVHITGKTTVRFRSVATPVAETNCNPAP